VARANINNNNNIVSVKTTAKACMTPMCTNSWIVHLQTDS